MQAEGQGQGRSEGRKDTTGGSIPARCSASDVKVPCTVRSSARHVQISSEIEYKNPPPCAWQVAPCFHWEPAPRMWLRVIGIDGRGVRVRQDQGAACHDGACLLCRIPPTHTLSAGPPPLPRVPYPPHAHGPGLATCHRSSSADQEARECAREAGAVSVHSQTVMSVGSVCQETISTITAASRVRA